MSWTSIVRVWSGMGPSEVISLALLQDVARDDQLLDFAGPLVDAQRAHFPVEALDGGAAHHALTAVDLDGPVHDALGGLGREELGRRAPPPPPPDPLRPAILEPGRAAEEEAGRLQVHVHLRERHLRSLEVGQRATE